MSSYMSNVAYAVIKIEVIIVFLKQKAFQLFFCYISLLEISRMSYVFTLLAEKKEHIFWGTTVLQQRQEQ